MFAWGSSKADDIACNYQNTASTSGISNISPDKIFKLLFENDKVSIVRSHHSVTAILLQDGSVHTFGQEDDILGHSNNTTKVSALDTLVILFGHLEAKENEKQKIYVKTRLKNSFEYDFYKN